MGTDSKDQTDLLWIEFVDKGLIEKGVRLGDLVDEDAGIPDLTGLGFVGAREVLKSALSNNAYQRLLGRFRKYKQRQLRPEGTITLRRETLDRLRQFAKQAQLDEDNYDLLFEYLLDPEEELEQCKQDVADMPTGLDINEQSRLLTSKMKLRGHTLRYMLNQIEYAFRMGWTRCKYLHGKKRTEAVLEEKTREFMWEIKGLD